MDEKDYTAKANEAAEKFVNEVAPEIYKASERAGITYNDEMVCHLLSDGFLAGFNAARLNVPPEVIGLRDFAAWCSALGKYDMNHEPTNVTIGNYATDVLKAFDARIAGEK